MRWTHKARIQRLVTRIPLCGHLLYSVLQRLTGQRNIDWRRGFSTSFSLIQHGLRNGVRVKGASVLEIGTGWYPLLPAALWLCGARVHTVDLNRYLSSTLTLRLARWMAEHGDELGVAAGDLADDDFRQRLAQLRERPASDAQGFIRGIDTRYESPQDAAICSGPYDMVVSKNVLEHIPAPDLTRIMAGLRPALAADGAHLHLIDPSDHFSHQDKSISSAHFLRFSEAEWTRLAGNRHAYHNRLRASQYRTIFEGAGYRIADWTTIVDPRALADVESGAVDPSFAHLDREDLAIRTVIGVMRPSAR